MELIRLVLLKAQADDPNGPIEGYTEDEISYHRKHAKEMGLLEAVILESSDRPSPVPAVAIVKDLTPAGHDFIDAIQSESNWSKVKDYLRAGGKQITIETIKAAIRALFGMS
jgi:hypothetical protein